MPDNQVHLTKHLNPIKCQIIVNNQYNSNSYLCNVPFVDVAGMAAGQTLFAS